MNTNWISSQIDFLLFLQNIREMTGGVLDRMFSYITMFGETLIPFLVMSVVYWCFSPKAGAYLFSLNGIAVVLTQVFKTIACVYRPWVLSQNVHPQSQAILRAGGYSFPSGHSVMASSSFGGTAYLARKKPMLCIFAIFIVLLVGFSRLYLGVHTPQDVVVGILTGVIMIYPVVKIIDWCEKDKNRYLYAMAAFDIFSLLVLFFICFKSYPMDYINGNLLVSPISAKYTGIIHTGMSMGAVTGSFLCLRFFPFDPASYTKKQKIIVGIVGIILAVVLLHLLDVYVWAKLCDFKVALLAGVLTTFSLAGIYPFLFTRILK